MAFTPNFIFGIWLCVVALIGMTRVYDSAPPQAIGLTIVAGTTLILLLHRFSTTFRAQMDKVSTEQLVCWHAIRAPIGAGFLVMASEGLLPDLFAERAGYGDLIAAISGMLVVCIVSLNQSRRLHFGLLMTWSIVGLIDLLVAVGTGIYMAFTVTNSMIWIARLPLLLVPTFILPVLFSSHFIIFGRLLRSDFDPKNED